MMARSWLFPFVIPAFLMLQACAVRHGEDRVYSDRPIQPAPANVRAVYLRSAIDSKPDVIENYIHLAALRMEENKLIEARTLLQAALQKEQGNKALVQKYAELLLAEGQPSGAIEVLLPFTEKSSGEFAYHLLMARAYGGLGLIHPGLDQINRALSVQRSSWEANYIKGRLLLSGGDSLAAFGYFAESYAQWPNRQAFGQIMALSYEKPGMPDGERYLLQHRENDPGDPVLFLWSGKKQLTDNQANTAISDLRQYVRLRPNDPEGYTWLGKGYLNLGLADSALISAQRALLIDEVHPTALLVRIQALDMNGQLFQAWNEMQRLLSIDSTSVAVIAESRKLGGKIAYLRLRQRKEEVTRSSESLKTLTPIKRRIQ